VYQDVTSSILNAYNRVSGKKLKHFGEYINAGRFNRQKMQIVFQIISFFCILAKYFSMESAILKLWNAKMMITIINIQGLARGL